MQRHRRSAELVDELFATRPDFFQIGRPKRRVSRARKDQISDLEIAHRPVVGRREAVDFFCNSQGRFADLVLWPDVAHDGGQNPVARDHDRIISHSSGIFSLPENSGEHNVGISRRNQEAEVLEGIDLRCHPLDPNTEIAVPLHGQAFLRKFGLVTSQFFLRRG